MNKFALAVFARSEALFVVDCLTSCFASCFASAMDGGVADDMVDVGSVTDNRCGFGQESSTINNFPRTIKYTFDTRAMTDKAAHIEAGKNATTRKKKSKNKKTTEHKARQVHAKSATKQQESRSQVVKAGLDAIGVTSYTLSAEATLSDI